MLDEAGGQAGPRSRRGLFRPWEGFLAFIRRAMRRYLRGFKGGSEVRSSFEKTNHFAYLIENKYVRKRRAE